MQREKYFCRNFKDNIQIEVFTKKDGKSIEDNSLETHK